MAPAVAPTTATPTFKNDTSDITSYTHLDQVRSRIDQIDQQLVYYINQRMEYAVRLGKLLKESQNELLDNLNNNDGSVSASTGTTSTRHQRVFSATSPTSDVHFPFDSRFATPQQREAKALQRVVQLNNSAPHVNGPLTSTAVQAIWSEISHSTANLQRPTVVAVASQSGTFIHAAAIERFGLSADTSYVCVADHLSATASSNVMTCVSAVWNTVQSGRAAYGVVPYYHPSTGTDINTMDMLSSSDNHLDIAGELTLQEEYAVMGRDPTKHLRRVYGVPTAIEACIDYLRSELSGCEIIVESDLRHAAAKVQENSSYALVAGILTAQVYQLKPIATISTVKAALQRKDNGAQHTVSTQVSQSCRYLVVAPRSSPPTGNDKTFVMFAVKDKHGALHDALAAFKSYNVSLTRIESRASRARVKIWDYSFFAELEGHQSSPEVQEAIEQLKQHANFIRVLGSCEDTSAKQAAKQ